MSGKIVRPHMGEIVGAQFVGHVKWLMKEHKICRDDAIKLMVHQSRNLEQTHKLWLDDFKRCEKQSKLIKDRKKGYKSLRRENRKLYMVIAILSVACVTLALM